MGDLATLLPNLPGLGAFGAFVAVVVILLRALAISDRRYRDEATAHRATQQELDDVREDRRNIEDKLDEVSRELRAVRATLAVQSGQISHLESELARLKTASP